MSMPLDRMVYWARKEIVGSDDQTLPDEDIIDLLNFSLWQLESNFDFRTRERCVNTELVVGQHEYDIGSIARLDAITSIAVIHGEGNRHKLSRTSRDWFDANANFEQNKGLPTRYLREHEKLTLHPVPSEALTLVVHFRQGVLSLSEDDNLTTNLPRNWDEIVISGAVWRGLKAVRAPAEQVQMAIQATGMLISVNKSVEEKETKDSRYARLNVIHEHPEDFLEGHEG